MGRGRDEGMGGGQEKLSERMMIRLRYGGCKLGRHCPRQTEGEASMAGTQQRERLDRERRKHRE